MRETRLIRRHIEEGRDSLSDSSVPDVPGAVPPSPSASQTTVGQRLDKAIADGQRLASVAAERARTVADKASPHVRSAVASANGALNQVSKRRPWLKPALIGVGAFVVALLLWTAISAMFGGDGDATASGSSGNGGTSAVTNSRQAFVATAKKMGQIDGILAQRALEMVEQQKLHRSAGWQAVDEMMYQATPETQAAYRGWRKSVQAQ